MDRHKEFFNAEEGPHVQPWDAWRGGSVPGLLVSSESLQHGEGIPTGWGIAWRAQDLDAVVVMPIPFNILARWIRRAWTWARIGPPGDIEVHRKALVCYEKGFNQGYEEGYTLGHEHGWKSGFEEGADALCETESDGAVQKTVKWIVIGSGDGGVH